MAFFPSVTILSHASNWWPHGHIIGWEHTFVHEIAHLLDAIVNNKEVAPYGATFEDGYRNAVICDAIVQSSLEGRRIADEVLLPNESLEVNNFVSIFSETWWG